MAATLVCLLMMDMSDAFSQRALCLRGHVSCITHHATVVTIVEAVDAYEGLISLSALSAC